MTEKTIVHATDLVHDDHLAFEHGIALARASGARLVSLHANANDDTAEQMPDAAHVLTKWGEDPTAVTFERLIHNCCDEPLETLLDAIGKIEPDLVIAATHEQSALARFFGGSGAEAIAHNAEAPTLLLPVRTRGFVGPNGELELRRVLVPIGDAQASERARRAAAWFMKLCNVTAVEFALLHVGTPFDTATDELKHAEWTVRGITLGGNDIERGIIQHAADASLIVMATRGHDSVGDVLRGSHTDRVLRETRCPVLSVHI